MSCVIVPRFFPWCRKDLLRISIFNSFRFNWIGYFAYWRLLFRFLWTPLLEYWAGIIHLESYRTLEPDDLPTYFWGSPPNYYMGCHAKWFEWNARYSTETDSPAVMYQSCDLKSDWKPSLGSHHSRLTSVGQCRVTCPIHNRRDPHPGHEKQSQCC